MAALYDGQSAIRHEVEVRREGDALALDGADGRAERVPLAELFLVERRGGELTLGRHGIDGWRLRVPPPVDPALDAAFPRTHGYGRWVDRLGLWPAMGAFTAVSAAVLALGWFAPGLLAPLVPVAVEEAYGSALVGDFGGKYCTNAAGQEALAKLVARLDPDPSDLKVRVVDFDMVNAAALPGGQIVLFDELIETVEGPDELAGVLAHEIAHVRERHVTAALLRQFGIGIFTATLGGNVGSNVDGFVALSFTRGAEREADAEAIARLNAARISPAPTADFFADLAAKEGGMGELPAMAYLSSHPLSAERKRLFEEAADKRIAYAPALSPAEWQALKAICAAPKRR